MPHVHHAGRKEQQAEQHLGQRQPEHDAARARRADHAFREVDPDQQAEPAIGVHAKFQDAGDAERQRQHLQRQRAVAGRREPQLPGQAECDQRQQADYRQRAHAQKQGIGRGEFGHGWHHRVMPLILAPAEWRARLTELSETLQTWPWLDTARTLRERFREDRLGLTASSLTFTTLIALVPLVTVMLAVFSAFPMFSRFQGALEKYFLQSLVPDGIAKPVLAALTQFATKATGLGSVGLVVLVLTALALMLTIDRALNAITRTRDGAIDAFAGQQK